MRKEITSAAELDAFIGQISIEAPLPVQRMLNSQLQIIRTLKAPTLIDSALSRMVEGLALSLEECNNEYEKKVVRRQFASMIENLIFFLDADLHKTLQDNDQLARAAFVQAGELFMDNMRDVMVMSINTFGTVGKVATTAAEHIGKDFMITLNGLGTEVINTIGASGFDMAGTTTQEGETTTQTTSFHKDTMSDEAVRINQQIGSEIIEKIDEHRGEASKEINTHIDNWVANMSNVVVHNIFSEEQNGKRNDLLHSLSQLLSKTKTEKTMMNDFLQTVANTIVKLKKYRAYIGPSILISDMIERYVRVLRNANVGANGEEPKQETFGKKVKKLAGTTGIGSALTALAGSAGLGGVLTATSTAFLFTPILPAVLGTTAAGLITASALGNNGSTEGITLDMALDDFQKVADSYNPLTSKETQL